MVMRGRKMPTIANIERVAEILKVRAAWLAFGEEPMEIPADGDHGALVAALGGSVAGVETEVGSRRLATGASSWP